VSLLVMRHSGAVFFGVRPLGSFFSNGATIRKNESLGGSRHKVFWGSISESVENIF
jgi:hypothetical protein